MLNTVNLFIALVVAAITYGTPLLFGTLGEVLTEKSGSLNLGVEGIMFMGGAIGLGGVFYYEKAVESPSAFLAVLIGLLCAFIAGGIASLIFSFLTITLRANQNVTGLALTIFGTGVGQYIGEIMRIREGGFVAVGNDLKAVFISSPFPQAMQDIPYVGKILFGNSIFFYLGVVLAIVMHLFLNKSRTGLQLRSVGESPAASLPWAAWCTSPPSPAAYGTTRVCPAWAGWPWRWLSSACGVLCPPFGAPCCSAL